MEVYFKMLYFQVCNHPELFERRDARSPLFIKAEEYEMPKLLYNEGILNQATPSKDHLLYNKFFIFAIEYIHRSLHCDPSNSSVNFFSFARLIDLSPMELNRIFLGEILFR